jgi:hypothetical protein
MMPRRPDEETIGHPLEELHTFLCDESRGLAENLVCPAITRIRLAQCRCGSIEFRLRASEDIVRRICPACDHEQFVCEPDTNEAELEWPKNEVADWSCGACGSDVATLGAGLGCFDFRAWFKNRLSRVTLRPSRGHARTIPGPGRAGCSGGPRGGADQAGRAKRVKPSSSSQCPCAAPVSNSAGVFPRRSGRSLRSRTRWFR